MAIVHPKKFSPKAYPHFSLFYVQMRYRSPGFLMHACDIKSNATVFKSCSPSLQSELLRLPDISSPARDLMAAFDDPWRLFTEEETAAIRAECKPAKYLGDPWRLFTKEEAAAVRSECNGIPNKYPVNDGDKRADTVIRVLTVDQITDAISGTLSDDCWSVYTVDERGRPQTIFYRLQKAEHCGEEEQARELKKRDSLHQGGYTALLSSLYVGLEVCCSMGSYASSDIKYKLVHQHPNVFIEVETIYPRKSPPV